MTRSNYIGGRWVEPKRGGSLAVINPATEETIDHVAASTLEDIDAAVTAAAAFPTWRQTSGKERAGHLRSIAAAITSERDKLARLEVADNGKPLPEALWDIDDAAGCFAYCADLAEELDSSAEQVVELPDTRFTSIARREPIGVAGQMIPWNYPLLMAAWYLK